MPDTKPSAADHTAPGPEARPQAAQQSATGKGQPSPGDSAPETAAAQAPAAKAPAASPPPAAPPKSLLSTFPGMLTAIGGVLAAVTALVTALNGATWLQPKPADAPPTAAVVATEPTTALTTEPMATALVIVVVATSTPVATDAPAPTATLLPTELPTAAAAAEPTANPTPSAEPLIVLDEDFVAPMGWGSPPGDGYRTSYDQGYASIEVNVPEVTVWDNVPLERPLANLSVQVDAWRAADSADGYYGLVVREQEPSHFYLFAVSSDGWTIVQRCDGESWLDLVPWTESELVLKGTTVNRLRVECHGGQMRFYVNGTLAQQVEDLTYTSGKLGLLAATFDEVPVKVMFDELSVRELAQE